MQQIQVITVRTEWDFGTEFENGRLSFHTTRDVAIEWVKEQCRDNGIFETTDEDAELTALMENYITIEDKILTINDGQ